MSAEVDELKQQVMELQSQQAFQEDAVRSLDDALGQQQQEIMLLRRQMELLQLRLQEQAVPAGTAETAAVDEKPPHY